MSPPRHDLAPAHEQTYAWSMALTLLRTKGPLATKRVVRGAHGKPRIEGYAKAKRFCASIVRFADVRALFALLQRLDRDPRRFLIRAALLPGLDPREVRRLVKRCGKTGEGPFFADVPRAWAAFDFDSVPAPRRPRPARHRRMRRLAARPAARPLPGRGVHRPGDGRLRDQAGAALSLVVRPVPPALGP